MYYEDSDGNEAFDPQYLAALHEAAHAVVSLAFGEPPMKPNYIRSFAIEMLQDPKYLVALEQRLLRGDCPEIDLLRCAAFHGPIPKAALEGIRWHSGLKCWVGQVYLNDTLVYRGQHRLLKDAVRALEEVLLAYKGVKSAETRMA